MDITGLELKGVLIMAILLTLALVGAFATLNALFGLFKGKK